MIVGACIQTYSLSGALPPYDAAYNMGSPIIIVLQNGQVETVEMDNRNGQSLMQMDVKVNLWLMITFYRRPLYKDHKQLDSKDG